MNCISKTSITLVEWHRVSLPNTDQKDIPRQNIGTGYVKMSKGKEDKFGVYRFAFLLPNDMTKLKEQKITTWEIIEDCCKKAVRYYNDGSSEKISAFYNMGDFIHKEYFDNGLVYYIEVYFTRNELFKYVLTQFHKIYSVI